MKGESTKGTRGDGVLDKSSQTFRHEDEKKWREGVILKKATRGGEGSRGRPINKNRK